MAYIDGYSMELRMMSYHSWYRVADLMRFVNVSRTRNWYLNEQRSQMLEELGRLAQLDLYSATTRFPEHGEYVCCGMGDWDRKIQQLSLALSFKDQVDRGSGASSQSTQAAAAAASTGSAGADSLVSFQNSLTAIGNQVVRRLGVYDRATFEATHNLTWQ